MQAIVNHDGRELTLIINGPHIRIRKAVHLPLDIFPGCDHHMVELARRLDERNFSTCKFETGAAIMGQVVMDGHPLMVGGIQGPVVTMFDGELVFHMLVKQDREFCIKLLTDLARVISSARVQNRQTVRVPERLMNVVQNTTVTFSEDGIICICVDHPDFKTSLRIPRERAGIIIQKLDDLYMGRILRRFDAEPISVYLDTYERLVFLDMSRYRHMVLRYESPVYSESMDLYFEMIPIIIRGIEYATPDLEISLSRTFQNEDIWKAPCEIPTSTLIGDNIYVTSRNIQLRLPRGVINGMGIFLRGLLKDIEQHHPRDRILKLGRLIIDVVMNPPANEHHGPILKVGEFLRYDLRESGEKHYIALLTSLITLADSSCASPSYANMSEHTVPLVYMGQTIGESTLVYVVTHDTTAPAVYIPTDMLRDALAQKFMIECVLTLDDEDWQDNLNFAYTDLDHGSLALSTTGNYREISMYFKNLKGDWFVTLSTDHLIPFVRAVAKWHYGDMILNALESELRDLKVFFERRFNHMFRPEKPKVIEASAEVEPKTNVVDTAAKCQANSWAELDADGRRDFLVYVMSAPLEVRKLIAGLALANQ